MVVGSSSGANINTAAKQAVIPNFPTMARVMIKGFKSVPPPEMIIIIISYQQNYFFLTKKTYHFCNTSNGKLEQKAS